jgi:hypothetical protein
MVSRGKGDDEMFSKKTNYQNMGVEARFGCGGGGAARSF